MCANNVNTKEKYRFRKVFTYDCKIQEAWKQENDDNKRFFSSSSAVEDNFSVK